LVMSATDCHRKGRAAIGRHTPMPGPVEAPFSPGSLPTWQPNVQAGRFRSTGAIVGLPFGAIPSGRKVHGYRRYLRPPLARLRRLAGQGSSDHGGTVWRRLHRAHQHPLGLRIAIPVARLLSLVPRYAPWPFRPSAGLHRRERGALAPFPGWLVVLLGRGNRVDEGSVGDRCRGVNGGKRGGDRGTSFVLFQ
jgi:hypothetical protein